MDMQTALNTVYGWYVLDKHEPADHAYFEPDTRRRCAIGCLLSDDTAEQTMSCLNLNVHGLLVTNSTAAGELAGLPEEFLHELQRANDLTLEDAVSAFLSLDRAWFKPGEYRNVLREHWPEIVARFQHLIEQRLWGLAYRFGLEWPGAAAPEAMAEKELVAG